MRSGRSIPLVAMSLSMMGCKAAGDGSALVGVWEVTEASTYLFDTTSEFYSSYVDEQGCQSISAIHLVVTRRMSAFLTQFTRESCPDEPYDYFYGESAGYLIVEPLGDKVYDLWAYDFTTPWMHCVRSTDLTCEGEIMELRFRKL